MNLSDTVLGKAQQAPETLTQVEAFAAISLLTTALDGYLSDEQAHRISYTLSGFKLFRSYSDDVMNRLFDKILSILRRDGFNTLFNAAKESLSQDLREAAFAVATDLVCAEGMVSEDEKIFLNDLSQALSIAHEIAIQIILVMSVKNQV